MNIKENLHKTIYELESCHTDDNIRSSKSKLSDMLSDDYVEFGESGKTYSKNDCLESVSCENSVTIIDFKTKIISDDVILSTFVAKKINKHTKEEKYSLRSSVWKLFGDKWKMIFHQGTPVKSNP